MIRLAWSADIDGSSITEYCQSIRFRSRLSGGSTGIVRYPAHLFSITPGVSELHIYDGGTLKHSGPCWYSQADGSEDSTYAEVTSYSHLIYLKKRLCKTAAGNLITPASVILNEGTAPAIIAAFIANANIYDQTVPSGNAMPLTVGSVAGGGDDVTGVPTNFPMTIDQMRELMLSTGQLDVVVNPGIGASTVDLYNGNYGSDLSGSVVYSYQTGSYNAHVASFTVDMEDVINALWYLLGPRGPLPGIGLPANYWGGSITPTAPNSGGDGYGPQPGGVWPPTLVARFLGSRAIYNYMQEIRIFDDNGDEQSIRKLFEEEWANEAHIRAVPRTFTSVKPDRGTALNFGVGDLIGVAAGSRLHGGFSGSQRVYEYEVTIDYDGIIEISEIIASADQEGQ